MSIDSVTLSEFGAFTELKLKFSPGINVFIGANATGKSQLLKLLYAIHRSAEGELSAGTVRKKLQSVFKPDHLGRLVHRRRGVNTATARVDFEGGHVRFSLSSRESDGLRIWKTRNLKPEAPAIFIPTCEALALFEGFISLYKNREVAFDETYYDLCLALDLPALRGPRGEKASQLIAPLEKSLGGKVVLEGGRFYLRRPDGDFEAHLVSEGLRKIGTLARLVTNGSLMNKGVLFWDEPEANQNPRIVRQLIEFLRTLAAQDVQVFLATHDALVTQRLSLAAEYGLKPKVPIRFFAFYRDHDEVQYDVGDTLAALEHNPILEEYGRFYDEERQAFEAAMSGDGSKP
jgi:ABC-type transport system involved in cytochrome c biogenesis ATPase subunit